MIGSRLDGLDGPANEREVDASLDEEGPTDGARDAPRRMIRPFPTFSVADAVENASAGKVSMLSRILRGLWDGCGVELIVSCCRSL